jgi:hypothetical protein
MRRPPLLTGGVLALVAAGLVVIASACASEVARSDLPISDDFSGDCEGWSQDNDEHISLGCEDGVYKALFKRTDERLHHFIPRRIEEPSDFVSVEADATLHAFPGGSSEDFQAHGVGCWSSEFGAPTQGYSFLVAPAANAIAIVKHDEADASLREQFYLRPLLDEESDAVASVGETNRIRGKCQATDDGVELTMYLDGKLVGQARDPNGFRQFEAFGFVVISTKTGTDIRFDNFEADEIGEFG